jgi:hypothetical protein
LSSTSGQPNEIDRIIPILYDIRDILEHFINEDFERLVDSNFGNISPDLKTIGIPIIRTRIDEAVTYLDSRRYDPTFRDALGNFGFTRPEIEIKISFFDKVKHAWQRVKNGPVRIARKCASVLFDEMDTILGSLAKIVPVLEPIIELKEHMRNAMSASDVLEEEKKKASKS